MKKIWKRFYAWAVNVHSSKPNFSWQMVVVTIATVAITVALFHYRGFRPAFSALLISLTYFFFELGMIGKKTCFGFVLLVIIVSLWILVSTHATTPSIAISRPTLGSRLPKPIVEVSQPTSQGLPSPGTTTPSEERPSASTSTKPTVATALVTVDQYPLPSDLLEIDDGPTVSGKPQPQAAATVHTDGQGEEDQVPKPATCESAHPFVSGDVTIKVTDCEHMGNVIRISGVIEYDGSGTFSLGFHRFKISDSNGKAYSVKRGHFGTSIDFGVGYSHQSLDRSHRTDFSFDAGPTETSGSLEIDLSMPSTLGTNVVFDHLKL
jgi:hypothetical protein